MEEEILYSLDEKLCVNSGWRQAKIDSILINNEKSLDFIIAVLKKLTWQLL